MIRIELTANKAARWLLLRLLAALITTVAAADAIAQQSAVQIYPTRPIRMVIAFPPGGSADLLARIIAPRLGETLGQQVVVDNRPGGRQLIASEMVAKSAPDGHTLFLQGTAHVTNPGLIQRLPYDSIKDFTPVTMVMESPLVFVAHPSVRASNITELISLAKTLPGKLNYGSSGPGTGGQLAVEMLKQMAKIDILHIPYKGAGPALTALLGGQVQIVCTSPLSVLPYTKIGKMKALAVTSIKRSRAMPDVSTVAESGLSGFHATVWYALLGPAKIPPVITDRLHKETTKVIYTPEVIAQLQDMGAEPVGNSPTELKRYLESEIDRWSKLIRQANISTD